MIIVDHGSSKSVTEQIVDQLRYEIASGQYRTGDTLPSTRQLGGQVGVSFHSVRKAYQVLEQEGLLASRVGSGFTVKERVPLGKAERIERGAALVHDTLQRLIGLGFEAAEVEYLIQEQLELMDSAAGGAKIVFAASCPELAEDFAQQVGSNLQQHIEAATMPELAQHKDADYIIAPFESLQNVLEFGVRGEVVGVITHLQQDVLEHASRLVPHQTIGLITRRMDTIAPLMAQLRRESGFSGQVLAMSLEQTGWSIDDLADQVDLLIYTPGCRRRLLSVLNRKQPNARISFRVSRDSLDALRGLIAS